MNRPFDRWTDFHADADNRPAVIASAMIVDGVPRGTVVAYLHLETVLEAGVDPWDASLDDTPTT